VTEPAHTDDLDVTLTVRFEIANTASLWDLQVRARELHDEQGMSEPLPTPGDYTPAQALTLMLHFDPKNLFRRGILDGWSVQDHVWEEGADTP
jgi:hypothetical protein